MKQVPAPMDCADCTTEDQHWFGCGLEGRGYEAHPDCVYVDGDEYRTCPRSYLAHPAVAQIYDEVEDYKRGALGCVLDLEAPHVAYLRAAAGALDHWQAKQQEQLASEDD